MSFTHGILNLTNWAGNVILPTLAGLFFRDRSAEICPIGVLRRRDVWRISLPDGFRLVARHGNIRFTKGVERSGRLLDVSDEFGGLDLQCADAGLRRLASGGRGVAHGNRHADPPHGGMDEALRRSRPLLASFRACAACGVLRGSGHRGVPEKKEGTNVA